MLCPHLHRLLPFSLTGSASLALAFGVFNTWLCGSQPVQAEEFSITTPAGVVNVEINPLIQGGQNAPPVALTTPQLSPLSIFSAPLPTGSGARALGIGGAFTAIADDATAASWNPAGLVQLEKPEASAVYRFSSERHFNRSSDADFLVAGDRFDTDNLNYLSAVFPYYALNRNWVFSLNYQEAYDFTQDFKARSRSRDSSASSELQSESRSGSQVDNFSTDTGQITVRSSFQTERRSVLESLQSSSVISEINFQQDGLIDAVTPSFGVEVTPRFSVGGSLNLYQNDWFHQRPIRSVTRTTYDGILRGQSATESAIVTTGSYEYEGSIAFPESAFLPAFEVPIAPVGGEFDPIIERDRDEQSSTERIQGTYTEINEFQNMHGANGNLGFLWSAANWLSIGGAFELPWTAKGDQVTTIRNEVTTLTGSRADLRGELQEDSRTEETVRMRFPGFWSLGMALKPSDRFYVAIDGGQTQWSDFYVQSGDGPRENPLNGEAYRDAPLDDTWTARVGMEYLQVVERVQIPLRAGFGWEERPALDQPDEFLHASLGTGLALYGKEVDFIFDIAYVLTWQMDPAQSLIPTRDSVETELEKHQIFCSLTCHF